MRVKTDECCEVLTIDGVEIPSEDGEVFDLLASSYGDIRLSKIPPGVKVQLCDPVIGSRELFGRYPYVSFSNSREVGLVAHLATVILPPSESVVGDFLDEYLREAVSSGLRSLESLRAAGRLLEIDSSVDEEIAFLYYDITLHDQTLLEGEAFASEIDSRALGAYQPPSLFLCHASEDKSFVDQLAKELDERALYGWYDKREVFVGDSIVEKINDALGESDYLVAVLSPQSVNKPWVMRELNSSLMRQLADRKIRVLPVLLETCEILPLLADLKYADFRTSFEDGVQELVHSIRRTRSDAA